MTSCKIVSGVSDVAWEGLGKGAASLGGESSPRQGEAGLGPRQGGMGGVRGICSRAAHECGIRKALTV